MASYISNNTTKESGNFSSTMRNFNERDQCFNLVLRIMPAFLYVLIFVSSLVGNSSIVATIFKEKLHQKAAHLFILNIAISDLLVTLVYIPRMVARYSIGRWWYVKGTVGLALCRIVPFLHHVTILVSVFTILGATVDRFTAIMFPLRNIMTRKRAGVIVITTWLGSAVARFPYLVTPILKPQESFVTCVTNLKSLFGNHQTIYEKVLLSIYCTSLLTTILLYAVVITKLKRVKTPGIFNIQAITRKKQASTKLLKVMIVISLCFILCWFTYFFAFEIFERPLNCYVHLARFIFAHANSALNPMILCYFDNRFRNNFKKTVLRMIRLRRKPSIKAFDRGVSTIQDKMSQRTSFVELGQNVAKTCGKSNYIEEIEMKAL